MLPNVTGRFFGPQAPCSRALETRLHLTAELNCVELVRRSFDIGTTAPPIVGTPRQSNAKALPPQARLIESPCTVMASVFNGRVAGPLTTSPSRLNLLPWHGQLMVPSATSLIRQPV